MANIKKAKRHDRYIIRQTEVELSFPMNVITLPAWCVVDNEPNTIAQLPEIVYASSSYQDTVEHWWSLLEKHLFVDK